MPDRPRVSLFAELGGEEALRRVVDLFVDRVFDDVLIGFHFSGVDRERIKEKEYEFAAKHLGADVEYTGRPLRDAHRAHPIMGGQFARRLELLEQTLEELRAPRAVIEHWLDHTARLRPLITPEETGRCDGVPLP